MLLLSVTVEDLYACFCMVRQRDCTAGIFGTSILISSEQMVFVKLCFFSYSCMIYVVSR